MRGRTIISCVVNMIRMLEMDLIAEGVETSIQAEFLKEQGCIEMQGYLFYKPMPAREFEKLIGLLPQEEPDLSDKPAEEPEAS